MTWKEFKACIDAEGVEDSDTIKFIQLEGDKFEFRTTTLRIRGRRTEGEPEDSESTDSG